MKYTFVITITFACLCAFTNGQFGNPVVTPQAGGGIGGGAGAGNGVGAGAGAGNGFGGSAGTGGVGGLGNGVNDYGMTKSPTPGFQPDDSFDDSGSDDSIEDSTTMNPNGNGADGANAQKSMSGGGQFALGFVAVLLVVGCAVILVFLVRRKRAQTTKYQTPATSA